MDEFSEFFGGIIFINDGVDAFDTFEDFGAIDRNAAAAGRNNNHTIFDKFADRVLLDDIDGLG